MEAEKHTTRSPFDGYPQTREETGENGRPRFCVTAKVLTPLRAKLADKLGAATAAIGAVAGVIYASNHDYPPVVLFAAAGIWFGKPLFEKLWRELVRRPVEIVVTEAEFRFRDWTGRWIVFDRNLPHSYALRLHDLAIPERDQHELQVLKAQQLKKIVQPRRYFQESYHLVYEFLGQRNDITEICGRPEARAVQNRLRAIDDVLKSRFAPGQGTPFKPEDQWARGPGVIQ
jgi:hypothetical protein